MQHADTRATSKASATPQKNDRIQFLAGSCRLWISGCKVLRLRLLTVDSNDRSRGVLLLFGAAAAVAPNATALGVGINLGNSQVPPPLDQLASAINWTAPAIGPTNGFATRAFDLVRWPGDGRWYLYCDLIPFANPACPSSFGSEIGAFSAPSLDAPGAAWTYHGIVLAKNVSAADAGGLATPTAIVRGGKVFVYFAYEGRSPDPAAMGGGLRGIGGASASHPLGPFDRMPPVAAAPAGWHRPSGPGGILDDPEVLFYAGRFHLFHSRKHLATDDRNCSLAPGEPAAAAPSHCMEWRTSADGVAWTRRGVLTPPPSGKAMGQTKSARVYGEQLVIVADGGGQLGFTANASGLAGDDPAALMWTPGTSVQKGMNDSFYGCALRVLPVDGPPTHAAIGWRQALSNASGWSPHPAGQPSFPLTFAVFPLIEKNYSESK